MIKIWVNFKLSKTILKIHQKFKEKKYFWENFSLIILKYFWTDKYFLKEFFKILFWSVSFFLIIAVTPIFKNYCLVQ